MPNPSTLASDEFDLRDYEPTHFMAFRVEDRICVNCGHDYCAHLEKLRCPRDKK